MHASPRSGSTYFFQVLRRDESLMCFNESLSDAFGYWGKKGTAQFAQFKERRKLDLNHGFLERDDFFEIVEAWDAVMHLYPRAPSFQDYLPPNGVLPTPLRAYLTGLLDFARAHDKRPALCEIHSRGRAGALRGAFGGFHIAQYRDPLSQFGSFFRPLAEAGEWGFLVFPLKELGISGRHPLYSIVPKEWRVPVLAWPVNDHARRWATTAQYNAIVAAPQADTLEKLFRWHLFSWVLSNLAAVSYSDFTLDIDKAHDDTDYRQSVIDAILSGCGVAADFGDITKFSRYFEFESFDATALCDQVEAVVRTALQDGRLENAVHSLGMQPPTVPVARGAELLLTKIRESLSAMQASADRVHIGAADWRDIAEKRRMIWFNPLAREMARRVYPLTAPLVRAARRAGVLH